MPSPSAPGQGIKQLDSIHLGSAKKAEYGKLRRALAQLCLPSLDIEFFRCHHMMIASFAAACLVSKRAVSRPQAKAQQQPAQHNARRKKWPETLWLTCGVIVRPVMACCARTQIRPVMLAANTMTGSKKRTAPCAAHGQQLGIAAPQPVAAANRLVDKFQSHKRPISQ